MAAPIPNMSGGAGGAASSGPATGGHSAQDNSGWVVNFGSGSVSSQRNDATGQYLPYAIGAAALLFAWRFFRK